MNNYLLSEASCLGIKYEGLDSVGFSETPFHEWNLDQMMMTFAMYYSEQDIITKSTPFRVYYPFGHRYVKGCILNQVTAFQIQMLRYRCPLFQLRLWSSSLINCSPDCYHLCPFSLLLPSFLALSCLVCALCRATCK